MNIPNLEKFWGVQLTDMQLDYAKMILSLELFWTNGESSERARLVFSGVMNLLLESEKIFTSEVVELISIEAEPKVDSVRVFGELSNYTFEIECAHVDELAA